MRCSVFYIIGYYNITDAKRLIGRRFSDPLVQSDINLWPFKVIEGPSDKPMIVVNHKDEEKHFAAEGISSMVLMKMQSLPGKNCEECSCYCPRLLQ